MRTLPDRLRAISETDAMKMTFNRNWFREDEPTKTLSALFIEAADALEALEKERDALSPRAAAFDAIDGRVPAWLRSESNNCFHRAITDQPGITGQSMDENEWKITRDAAFGILREVVLRRAVISRGDAKGESHDG